MRNIQSQLKKGIILLFCFTLVFGYAQKREVQKPNYKKIEKKIKKEGSDYYYPMLLDRFIKADTTLTLEQKRCLYYGYTFQSIYSPYGDTKFRDSISVVMKKEEMDISDYEKIIVFSDSALLENPFDLDALNYLLYCHDFLQNSQELDKTIAKFRIVFEAILSSGSGETLKDPYYVISVDHEYMLLNIFGYHSVSQSLIGTCDYLKLETNEDKIEGLYFDVTPSFNYLNNLFK